MTNFAPILDSKASMRLITSIILDDEDNSYAVYGLEVVEMLDNNKEYRRLICDICCDKERMETFVENLNMGEADPIHLDYIIEDFISFSN